MKKFIIILLLSFFAPASAYESSVEEVYEYHDIFEGGALLYRPRGTEGLAVFDLNESTVILMKYKDYNCMKIVIVSKDGTIIGPCVKKKPLEPRKSE